MLSKRFITFLWGVYQMPKFARLDQYQQVRLKQDRPSVSEHPFTALEVPRAVTVSDVGIIIDVYDVERPGYEVEFFDGVGNTIDLLTLNEDEIEHWE